MTIRVKYDLDLGRYAAYDENDRYLGPAIGNEPRTFESNGYSGYDPDTGKKMISDKNGVPICRSSRS